METPTAAKVIEFVLLASLALPTATWIVPQLKANVWSTVAKSMGQDHICLS